MGSGLDNAGKTTIVKKFNGECIDTISPTLGFSIQTLEHRGLSIENFLLLNNTNKSKSKLKLKIKFEKVQNEYMGCWRPANYSFILEKLLRGGTWKSIF